MYYRHSTGLYQYKPIYDGYITISLLSRIKDGYQLPVYLTAEAKPARIKLKEQIA